MLIRICIVDSVAWAVAVTVNFCLQLRFTAAVCRAFELGGEVGRDCIGNRTSRIGKKKFY